MSTQRKSLFARKPRGNNPSSSDKKDNHVVRIDANFLRNLEGARMNRNLSDLLAKTGGQIRVQFSKEGHSSVSIVGNDGRLLADAADIQKAQTMGAFINNERKTILKTESGTSLRTALAAFVILAKEKGDTIRKLPKSFVQQYRGVEASMKILAANQAALEKADPKGAELSIKSVLMEMAERIRGAVGKFLTARSKQTDEADPVKLNSFLFDNEVPAWMFHRLTAARISVSAEFSFRTFIFPKDPTKGFSLSFKEIRSSAMCNALLGLMDNMGLVVKAFRSDEFLRPFLGVANDVNLDSLEDAVAKTLQNVPILVVPHVGLMDLDETISSLVKEGIRGYPWNVGGAVTPQDNLKFLGTLFKRANILALPRAGFKAPLIAGCIPGFKFVSGNLELNVYAQLKAAVKAGLDNPWMGCCFREAKFTEMPHRKQIAAILRDLLGISLSEYGLYNHVAVLCGDVDAMSADVIFRNVAHGTLGSYTDLWSPHILKKTTLTDDNQVTAILNTVGALELLSGKVKKEREMTVEMVRSILTPQAARVIAEVKSRKYVVLSKRLDDWFRGFLTPEFQAAAANSLAAKIDWFLKQPIKYGREDHAAFLEPGDFSFFDFGDQTDHEEGDDDDNQPVNPSEQEEVRNPDE